MSRSRVWYVLDCCAETIVCIRVCTENWNEDDNAHKLFTCPSNTHKTDSMIFCRFEHFGSSWCHFSEMKMPRRKESWM